MIIRQNPGINIVNTEIAGKKTWPSPGKYVCMDCGKFKNIVGYTKVKYFT